MLTPERRLALRGKCRASFCHLAEGQPVNAFLSLPLDVCAQVVPVLCRGGGAALRGKCRALVLHGRRPSNIEADAKRRGVGSAATEGQACFDAKRQAFSSLSTTAAGSTTKDIYKGEKNLKAKTTGG